LYLADLEGGGTEHNLKAASTFIQQGAGPPLVIVGPSNVSLSAIIQGGSIQTADLVANVPSE